MKYHKHATKLQNELMNGYPSTGSGVIARKIECRGCNVSDAFNVMGKR